MFIPNDDPINKKCINHIDEDKTNNSVSNLEDNMNTSFRDGVITEAECISIKNSLSRLDTEKADVDAQYNELYNNKYLN